MRLGSLVAISMAAMSRYHHGTYVSGPGSSIGSGTRLFLVARAEPDPKTHPTIGTDPAKANGLNLFGIASISEESQLQSERRR